MKLVKKLMFCSLVICLPFLGKADYIKSIPKDTLVNLDTISTLPVKIHNIYIVGNIKTKQEIIIRELTYKKNDVVPLNVLYGVKEEDRDKIYNTNLFNTVDLQILEIDSATVDIVISVSERWYFYPSVNAELGDRNINDWLFNRNGSLDRFNFGIGFDKYNFRGRMEKIKFVGQLGLERQLLLQYKIPYIEKSLRHGLEFNVSYSEIRAGLTYETINHNSEILGSDTLKFDQLNRSSYSGSIKYNFRNNFYRYNQLVMSFAARKISDTVAFFNPNYFGDGRTEQRLFKLAYAFVDDHRNNRNYPLKGYYLISFIEKVGLGIFDDIDIWRLSARYSRYMDLKNHLYLGVNVSGFISSKENVPYFNYRGFGFGNYLVSGYDAAIIEGFTNVLTKATLKKRIFNHTSDISKVMPLRQFQKVPLQIFAKVFFDTGWTANYPDHTTSDRLSNKFLYGAGVGLDFLTINDIVPQVEASINAQGEFNVFFGVKAEF